MRALVGRKPLFVVTFIPLVSSCLICLITIYLLVYQFRIGIILPCLHFVLEVNGATLERESEEKWKFLFYFYFFEKRALCLSVYLAVTEQLLPKSRDRTILLTQMSSSLLFAYLDHATNHGTITHGP